jgi:hypothetical protein
VRQSESRIFLTVRAASEGPKGGQRPRKGERIRSARSFVNGFAAPTSDVYKRPEKGASEPRGENYSIVAARQHCRRLTSQGERRAALVRRWRRRRAVARRSGAEWPRITKGRPALGDVARGSSAPWSRLRRPTERKSRPSLGPGLDRLIAKANSSKLIGIINSRGGLLSNIVARTLAPKHLRSRASRHSAAPRPAALHLRRR